MCSVGAARILYRSQGGLAAVYQDALSGTNLAFDSEPEDFRSNYWLNAVVYEDKAHRDALLETTNPQGVMTRPIWALMNHLQMYQNCRRDQLSNAGLLEKRTVNLHCSVFKS